MVETLAFYAGKGYRDTPMETSRWLFNVEGRYLFNPDLKQLMFVTLRGHTYKWGVSDSVMPPTWPCRGNIAWEPDALDPENAKKEVCGWQRLLEITKVPTSDTFL